MCDVSRLFVSEATVSGRYILVGDNRSLERRAKERRLEARPRRHVAKRRSMKTPRPDSRRQVPLLLHTHRMTQGEDLKKMTVILSLPYRPVDLEI